MSTASTRQPSGSRRSFTACNKTSFPRHERTVRIGDDHVVSDQQTIHHVGRLSVVASAKILRRRIEKDRNFDDIVVGDTEPVLERSANPVDFLLHELLRRHQILIIQCVGHRPFVFAGQVALALRAPVQNAARRVFLGFL